MPSPSWRYRLADALTYLLSPLNWPPFLFGLTLIHRQAPWTEVVLGSLLALVFWGILPLLYLFTLLRHDQIDSVEVRTRAQRTKPLLVSVVCQGIGLGVMTAWIETATPLLMALALAMILNTVIVLLITLRWKISLHTSGLAGYGIMLLFVWTHPWTEVLQSPLWYVFQGAFFVWWILNLALLMWARVHVRAHTVAQVLGGTLFGLILPYAELYLFAWLGWL